MTGISNMSLVGDILWSWGVVMCNARGGLRCNRTLEKQRRTRHVTLHQSTHSGKEESEGKEQWKERERDKVDVWWYCSWWCLVVFGGGVETQLTHLCMKLSHLLFHTSHHPNNTSHLTAKHALVSMEHFTIVHDIGQGSYGRVVLVQDMRHTGDSPLQYVIKLVDMAKLKDDEIAVTRQEAKVCMCVFACAIWHDSFWSVTQIAPHDHTIISSYILFITSNDICMHHIIFHQHLFTLTQMMQELRHPHIIACIDVFEQLTCLHIVLEYAEGGDLEKIIKARFPYLFLGTCVCRCILMCFSGQSSCKIQCRLFLFSI